MISRIFLRTKIGSIFRARPAPNVSTFRPGTGQEVFTHAPAKYHRAMPLRLVRRGNHPLRARGNQVSNLVPTRQREKAGYLWSCHLELTEEEIEFENKRTGKVPKWTKSECRRKIYSKNRPKK